MVKTAKSSIVQSSVKVMRTVLTEEKEDQSGKGDPNAQARYQWKIHLRILDDPFLTTA